MSRHVLAGERKQVTVLFADLKGSMELLADRDPEDARQLLDPVLARLMAAVHRYEGTVNQVMGDGIMVLFGAPVAHEDHTVRACYAAWCLAELGAFAEGLVYGSKAIQIAQTAHHVLSLTLALWRMGYLYLLRGDLPRAIPLLARRLDEARLSAERALNLARTHQERGSEAWTLRLLGGLTAHEPAVQGTAASYYVQALTLAEELGMRPLQAHCHRGLGMLYATSSQQEQARAELSAAMEIYRTM